MRQAVGQAIRVPKLASKLHERIVEEAVVRDILGIEGSARDITLVRFLYISGARISEAMGLLSGLRPSLPKLFSEFWRALSSCGSAGGASFMQMPAELALQARVK